ncbi:sugar ABC transporter permease [Muricomes sp. OA1]|uniref:Sugar ABC transporter permease n=3 Tax=Lachnospiraceae TaxID=186803 RepID=A0A3E2WMF2_9FIRM|nr:MULTISPECIES: sugar ABC transporter permease [Clostridia]MEE0199852.1 sugar ABC transporter permease [Muricomes sp.]MCH1970936.1 sugar ABC transporter permease [Muricomes sp. OA1]MRM90245.1 sugar ABC transporter permease [Faecalicatena contorta]RGC28291.1 sugar ABC transporter permease [Hungatella hathewayi]GKH34283.1 spermidine/putrescine ABC transporter permease [Faecalicatena contorta]
MSGKYEVGIKENRKKKRSFLQYAFIVPHMILFIIFVCIPIVFGIYISFTNWDMIGTPEWVGLANYKEILLNSKSTFNRQFMEGIRNTLLFVVLNVPLCIVVPLGFALVLHLRPYGSKFFQSVLYLPTLFSVTSVGLIWMQLLNRRFGLASMMGAKVPWATTMPYAWIALMVMTVWWTMGANMVIYQAALSGVSQDLYEAAEIDGAGGIVKFFKITLPSIRFQLLYTLVITVAGSFNVYGQPTIMTRVDPATAPAVKVLVYHIRNIAFGSGQSAAGIASAMAVILGIFIAIISIFQFKLIRNED